MCEIWTLLFPSRRLFTYCPTMVCCLRVPAEYWQPIPYFWWGLPDPGNKFFLPLFWAVNIYPNPTPTQCAYLPLKSGMMENSVQCNCLLSSLKRDCQQAHLSTHRDPQLQRLICLRCIALLQINIKCLEHFCEHVLPKKIQFCAVLCGICILIKLVLFMVTRINSFKDHLLNLMKNLQFGVLEDSLNRYQGKCTQTCTGNSKRVNSTGWEI